jgi:DNA-directed RNA polymerase subunit RPC12/RpoP
MPVYACPRCGRRIELPEGNYYCKICGPSARLVKASIGHLELCTLLKRKFMVLLDEIKREPELAEKRMAEAEEKIRRYRDKIFDEQGRLIDPED